MSVGRKWRCSNKYCPTRKTWVQQQRCGFLASSPRFVALMQGYVDIDEKEEILGAAKEAVKAIVVDTPICWYCRNSAESISEDQAVAVLQKHEEPLIERLIARSLEHAEMIIAAMVRVKAELQCPK